MDPRKIILPSPATIKRELPLSGTACDFIKDARMKAEKIVKREEPLFALIVGPCSIHDPGSALEYALRLKKLSEDLSGAIFLVMRFFIEKPRTRLGWKGLMYDPFLDGSNNIEEGIRLSRKLLLEIAELKVPCASELLEPLAVEYLGDLISWGLVGARTSGSQPHRQLASGLPFPVGFKNGVNGEIDIAISALLSSRMPHSHISINEQGRISAVNTRGNPLTHIVLRGSNRQTNFDPEAIANASLQLSLHGLDPALLIDCGHGNCGRDHLRQKIAFQSVVKQIEEGNKNILGVMLESHLLEGNQPLLEDPFDLRYGVSITDPCLGWEETEELIRFADEAISMSSVQK